MGNVLVFSCLHAPYHHPGAVDFLADLARREKPQRVVCLGDEVDAHAISRWPADPDLDSPGVELDAAVKALQPLYAAFPKVAVCESNHTLRPWLRARQAGLPARALRSPREVFEAPREWQWAPLWELYGIVFVHGEGLTGTRDAALRAAEKYRRPVAMGHLHSVAGVNWSHGPFDVLWGLSAGCLIDPKSPAFAYARQSPARPALGAGLITDGVPRWVPMKG